MIPKIIHYCWFGGKSLPPFAKKCIASWKKYCPDYEIKCWNESNFDVNICTYTKQAYQAKKWAFVSDVARLYIIYKEGGFYLDTDVELVRSLNPLLSLDGFVASDEHGINTGVGFGSKPYHDTIKRMYDLYQTKIFLTPSGLDVTPCTEFNTKIFLEQGYVPGQTQITKIADLTIFPAEYFSPIQGKTSELHLTPNTYSIHWSSLSWETGITKLKAKLRLKLGLKPVAAIKKIINYL